MSVLRFSKAVLSTTQPPLQTPCGKGLVSRPLQMARLQHITRPKAVRKGAAAESRHTVTGPGRAANAVSGLRAATTAARPSGLTERGTMWDTTGPGTKSARASAAGG